MTMRLRTSGRFAPFLAIISLLAAGLIGVTANGQQQMLVPDDVQVSEAVVGAIESPWLSDDERSAMRVFHGMWDDEDLQNRPTLQAMVALQEWRLDHPSLTDPAVPVELRAEGLLKRGELEDVVELLAPEQVTSIRAARLRAVALEQLDRFEEADALLDGIAQVMERQRIDDPAELTEGVNALILRARINGTPARDYHTFMAMLSRAHQELDRLYWPAKLAEAELLMTKDNVPQAIEALHEVLTLNPRSSRAWYLLGDIALRGFDFDSAERAVNQLRVLSNSNPMATVLLSRARLRQDDPEAALYLLEPLVERWPKLLDAHELIATAHAIRYQDDDQFEKALARCEALAPGSADVYFVVGRQLSLNRQYDAAGEMLREAIRREPNWPAPQIELGLMELQAGRDLEAISVLEDVTELDPFNTRAANSLHLIRDVVENYDTIETANFIIRYKPGDDQVLAEMMPAELERAHIAVTQRFQFQPPQKTIIEVLPDHERFAVRITGVPDIFTIAACTGPVIAMEVPRIGPQSRHLGLFDWPRVMQHEYTHTVTLAQTSNRIPHWLTEACAVQMEEAPRSYRRCVLLSEAYKKGTLFSLDRIKWGFVRPRQPDDRAKAYAQAEWMLDYMDEAFGRSAVIRLLEQYDQGVREQDAMPNALGVSREAFFDGFLSWAGEQVRAWGMDASPSIETLKDQVRRDDPEMQLALAASRQARLDVINRQLTRQIGQPMVRGQRKSITAADWPPVIKPEVELTIELAEQWLAEHPDHPDLWELRIRAYLDEDADTFDEQMVNWLERYAELRPVDPMPHKRLAQHWLNSDQPQRAIPHLTYLDVREESSPVYALELARLHRQQGDIEQALQKATRALHLNPYHAANRELAAAIAVEAGDIEAARQHIFALTLLEPDRPQHQKRLQRIDQMLQGG